MHGKGSPPNGQEKLPYNVFLKSGLDNTSSAEFLELFLSLSRCHKKCKKLAQDYLSSCGSLRVFITVSDQKLEKAGICPKCIFKIKLLREIPSRLLREKTVEQPVYSCAREVVDYLRYSLRDLEKEVFKVIYLNNRNQIIDMADLFQGSADNIPISPREIEENALKYNATALIFAHNHPTGDPAPSRSDKQLTRDLVFMGNILQIKVLDHIIIGANSYFSFNDAGLIQKYEDAFLNLRIRALSDSRFGGRQVPTSFN